MTATMVLQFQQPVAFRQSESLLQRVYSFDHSLNGYGNQILTLAILPILHVDLELSCAIVSGFPCLARLHSASLNILTTPAVLNPISEVWTAFGSDFTTYSLVGADSGLSCPSS
jgi:hypothetical protein